MSATREDIKLIATKFFRWWWNQPGANTDEGFEEWASTEGAGLIAAALSTEPGEAEEMVLVPKAALDWLFGEGPDHDGVWFGDVDRLPGISGSYWWRTVFRQMMKPPAAPLPEDTHHGR